MTSPFEFDANAIFDSLCLDHTVIMLLIDPAQYGKIIDANSAACQFYGYSREQLLQFHISDINTATPQEIQQAMNRMRIKQENVFLFKHRLASGEIRRVEVHSAPVICRNQRVLFSIIHDREAACREQEAQQSLLERLQQEVAVSRQKHLIHSRLVSTQVHQLVWESLLRNLNNHLETPLRTLELLLDHMQVAQTPSTCEEIEGDDPEYRSDQMLPKSLLMLQGISHTIETFQYFFSLSRLRDESFYLVIAVQGAVQVSCIPFQNPPIQLQITGDHTLVHSGSRFALGCAVLFLINNAAEVFQERAEHVKKPILSISIGFQDDYKAIAITDNAGGIDRAVRDTLFDPSVTTHQARNALGMGLYTARLMIEREFGGWLTVTTDSQGSTFTILLPNTGDSAVTE
ncbi:PAS domain-containing protein [Chrysiogenes arsenatis]|uniref:PAS domain-containing protein n=1 Tax=Chrysiogenes arsenatis TaxID=309797 RepID=UPI00041E182F|nr:PAS domain-containing sensor histidine kinase [Chrysiogenes arsenatis]